MPSKCPLCDVVFPTARARKQHVWREHTRSDASGEGGRFCWCGRFCGSQWAFEAHLAKQGGAQRHWWDVALGICVQCY